MNKRRRRNGYCKKTRMNFTAILAIISIAVFLGYGAARFVIYPLLGAEAFFLGEKKAEVKGENLNNEKENAITQNENSEIHEDADTENKAILEDGLNVETNDKATESENVGKEVEQEGYYIQFGSFSNKESAEKLIRELSGTGIEAEIIEKDGSFKVRSTLFDTKEAAKMKKETFAETPYSDAFITD